ncbi:MAG: carbohydrate kinase [Cytophagaceae bacterium]|nr:carbohydrate kinase [Cytophagaceae bacterium]MBP6093470.1 carbohydrate kinase [Cytophagaceae bacterium]
MNSQRLEALLAKISALRIAVIGDFALDFYFDFNPNTTDFSIETGKQVQHASKAKTYLGGAGNVAKNLACLGVQVDAFGLRGDDVFGREMEYLAQSLQINTQQLKSKTQLDTPTYSKPMQAGIEQSRLDFGTQNQLFQQFTPEIIHELAIHASSYDWIIINEQFQIPLLNQATFEYLQKYVGEHAIADLRSLGQYATNTLLKVNELELTKIIGNTDDLEKAIKNWVAKRQKPVLVTLGEQGMIYASPAEFHWEKAIPLHGSIDTVGAGDMVVAAFSAARASGANIQEACLFASLAVHVSIHKMGETGSASPQEIIDAYYATRN